jgi:hypothetical protein
MGPKEDHRPCMILVCAQMVKNQAKQELKNPYVSIARGMKSLFNIHLMYDHVFF